jgi:hypothetical protein
MNKKILFSLMLVMVLSLTLVSACSYHDHNTCQVDKNTIVEGKITFDNGTAIGKASVTVVCAHGKKTYTETTKTVNSGLLKGTYIVTFPQTHCKATDTVTVTASKGSVTGTKTGTVKDFIKEKCLDLDIALVNVVIPTVPEFGLIAGLTTVLSALGLFFIVRR